MSPVLQMPHSKTAPLIWDELKSGCSPVGVLLRNEEEGVIGGVTGGVRLPLLWRGGVDTFPRDTVLDKVRESFGWIFFFKDSCSRRAASVINLEQGQSRGWELWTTVHQQALGEDKVFSALSDPVEFQTQPCQVPLQHRNLQNTNFSINSFMCSTSGPFPSDFNKTYIRYLHHVQTHKF